MDNNIVLPSVGQLFSGAWQSFRKQWQNWALILWLPALLVAVGEALPSVQQTSSLLNWIIYLLIVIIGGISLSFGFLAVVHSLFEELKPTQAWDKSLRQTPSFIWLIIVNVFFVFGGLLFFIVPLVLYTIWFSLSIFCFSQENQRGLNALWRSREFFRGVFWRMTGRYLLMILAVAIISLFLSLLSNNLLSGIILRALTTLLVLPFSYAYMAELYKARLISMPPAQLLTGARAFKTTIISLAGWVLGAALVIIFVLLPKNSPAATAVDSLTSGFEKIARDTERQTTINGVIQPVLNLYYQKNKKYPDALTMKELGEWLNGIPTDPSGGDYPYIVSPDSKGYRICPKFEQRPEVCFGPTPK